MGVLLTDGIGEIELASAFRPYTEFSYLARPLRDHRRAADPVPAWPDLCSTRSSEHCSATLDRLVVPVLTQPVTRTPTRFPCLSDWPHLSPQSAWFRLRRRAARHRAYPGCRHSALGGQNTAVSRARVRQLSGRTGRGPSPCAQF